MVNEFEMLIEILRDGFRELFQQERDVKLLNVGTNSPSEYHWRFRLPDGTIVNVSVNKETS